MTEYICTKCGYQGHRRVEKPGSRGMEIFLWAVLLVPGPFYSAWRFFGKKHYCPHCGMAGMVSTRSTRGMEYIFEQEEKLSGIDPKDRKF